MSNDKKRRRNATLWFLASAAMLAAAVFTYLDAGDIRWLAITAAALMMALGILSLRSPVS